MKDNTVVAKEYTDWMVNNAQGEKQMTQCCNDFGNCTQGRDCPIRKQRAQEANDAYVKGYIMGQEDPLDDIADIFKALILVIAVTAAVTLLAFLMWGK